MSRHEIFNRQNNRHSIINAVNNMHYRTKEAPQTTIDLIIVTYLYIY